LPIQESNDLRWRLECARQVYLEWDNKNEEALENCRRLLNLTDITDERREHLLDREAYNLFRLDRVEEGLSRYDRRIAVAADAGDASKRLRLLFWKSQMVLGRDPVEQSIAICQEYRDATLKNTDDRFEATSLLARELRRANRHLDALQLVDELLEERRDAWQLLDAAESYIALKNTGKALNVITEAEKHAGSLKLSQRKSDRDQYAYLAGRIVALKEDLADTSQAKGDRTKD